MSFKSYIGIQDLVSPKYGVLSNGFYPLFNDEIDSSRCPTKFSDMMAFATDRKFMKDLAKRVKEGKQIILGGVKQSIEDTRVLASNLALIMVTNLAEQGVYSNPTSEPCRIFYDIASKLPADTQNWIAQEYNAFSGYEFKPELLDN